MRAVQVDVEVLVDVEGDALLGERVEVYLGEAVCQLADPVVPGRWAALQSRQLREADIERLGRATGERDREHDHDDNDHGASAAQPPGVAAA